MPYADTSRLQTPHSMKGLTFSFMLVWVACFNVILSRTPGLFLTITGSQSSSEFYYYLFLFTSTLTLAIAYYTIAKRYRLRVRQEFTTPTIRVGEHTRMWFRPQRGGGHESQRQLRNTLVWSRTLNYSACERLQDNQLHVAKAHLLSCTVYTQLASCMYQLS